MALVNIDEAPYTLYICDSCGEVIEGEFYRVDDKHYCTNCVYVDSIEDSLYKNY